MKVSLPPKDGILPCKKYGRWMRLAIWYRHNPILKHLDPYLFLWVLLLFALVSIVPRGNCTCEDQYPDQQLSMLAKAGNKEVAAHLAARDNALLCESRRQELLKELARKKHLE
ncbi:hypothetical protein [Pedobacter psychroterrae]|uniref:Uncharacterized protein n=1 Tax=Pedobacter psychroterrae TaxID=2530453 RepID=A0A4R0NM23_9SPHI|nr:hypothetical protein [Pedobacter psychroterrae]TCD01239.1 hypothetical protein EZ437_10810 [Pedobacter psychroterrae]